MSLFCHIISCTQSNLTPIVLSIIYLCCFCPCFYNGVIVTRVPHQHVYVDLCILIFMIFITVRTIECFSGTGHVDMLEGFLGGGAVGAL